MKELDYICKKITDKFLEDGTISNIDKDIYRKKILAAKYEIEQELLQFKIVNCHSCNESMCLKKQEYVLHCLSKGD